jgi:hypothetical protein
LAGERWSGISALPGHFFAFVLVRFFYMAMLGWNTVGTVMG